MQVNFAMRRNVLRSAGALALAYAMPGLAFGIEQKAKPVLLAHRGASALRPEHTLAAYAKAILEGADFIEPDLVCTKDGVLVARHENFMSETTDIAARPEFASRKATKTIDGTSHEGWFVSDFTFAELKTLRAVERLAAERSISRAYDGQFQLLSLEEIIDFVAAEAAARGRVIGLVPELKHSTYFASIGLPLEDRFVATLRAHAYTRRAPVHVQSFETANLKALRKTLTGVDNVRLVQLVVNGGAMDARRPADVVAAGGSLTFGAMTSARGLQDIAAYADIVAPPTRGVIPLGAGERLARPLPIVADAHKAGLPVHTWTFRPENMFLAADFRDDAGPNARNEAGSIAEMRRYLETGIDGLFSDNTALARVAIG
jgi:glycerophosphoryl diester phosphodiesterase